MTGNFPGNTSRTNLDCYGARNSRHCIDEERSDRPGNQLQSGERFSCARQSGTKANRIMNIAQPDGFGRLRHEYSAQLITAIKPRQLQRIFYGRNLTP